MPPELIEKLIAVGGLPAAILFFMWWDGRKNAPKKDATAEVLETLRTLDSRTDELNGRVIRLETKMDYIGRK